MITRWIARLLALLLCLVSPLYFLLLAFSTYTSSIASCTGSTCTATTTTTSMWLDNPPQTAGLLILTLLGSALSAALVYRQSQTRSTALLILMWLLAPLLIVAVFPFPPAFFWGVFVLIAAVLATVRHMIDGRCMLPYEADYPVPTASLLSIALR